MLSHQAIYTYKRSRRGLTLVEMMVSVALTLMVVFALVRVFEALGGNVTTGRATIEMSANLRSAAQLLRSDLAGLTVTTLPPRTPEQGEGYLEIVDGPVANPLSLRGTSLEMMVGVVLPPDRARGRVSSPRPVGIPSVFDGRSAAAPGPVPSVGLQTSSCHDGSWSLTLC